LIQMEYGLYQKHIVTNHTPTDLLSKWILNLTLIALLQDAFLSVKQPTQWTILFQTLALISTMS
jgi:hypothetical protein